jgi:hypothetical protein
MYLQQIRTHSSSGICLFAYQHRERMEVVRNYKFDCSTYRTCVFQSDPRTLLQQWHILVTAVKGRAMAQAVSRRSLTAEGWVRSRVSPCGICDGQSGTGTSFSPSTSVFPRQFHSTGAPLHGKTKKTNHLHHRVAQ